jgi:hypothetical protein
VHIQAATDHLWSALHQEQKQELEWVLGSWLLGVVLTRPHFESHNQQKNKQQPNQQEQPPSASKILPRHKERGENTGHGRINGKIAAQR